MVKIEYSTWTPEELLQSWTNSQEASHPDSECNRVYKITGCWFPSEWAFDYLDAIQTVAKECELYFCTECNHFVEVQHYIKTLDKCIECHTKNWD